MPGSTDRPRFRSGRVGFFADGEIVVLLAKHVVDGQDAVFRTDHGSEPFRGRRPGGGLVIGSGNPRWRGLLRFRA